MSFDTDTRPTYAIGIILDGSLKVSDATKVVPFFTAIRETHTEKNKEENEYTLKNFPQETKVNIYIAVDGDVPKAVRQKLHEALTGDDSPTNIKVMWFDNTTNTREELERRLRQWIGEDGPTKVWIVDTPDIESVADVGNKFK